MRLLLIAPHFPPKNSPGATRMLQLSTLLGERGVDVVVATHDGGQRLHDEVPIPGSATVLRAEPPSARQQVGLLERHGINRFVGFTSIPDRAAQWNDVAAKMCVAEHGRRPFDVILSSSNPVSACLLAAQLSKQLAIPFVAEFRDPWTQNPFVTWASRIHYEIERRQHQRVCARATHIVMNTNVARRQILREFDIPTDKVHVITNGFDPEDYRPDLRVNPGDGPVEFAHVGNLYSLGPPLDRNWKGQLVDGFNEFGTYARTSFDPLCRSPYHLFDAMARLWSSVATLDTQMRFHQVGSVGASPDEFTRLVDHFGLTGLCRQTLRVTRAEALAHERAADVLVLAQLKPGDGSECPAVAAKTYGALASGKPILGLVPRGDMRRLLEESGRAVIAEPDDPDAIAGAVEELLQRSRSSSKVGGCMDLARFHWSAIADQMLGVLESTVRERRV